MKSIASRILVSSIASAALSSSAWAADRIKQNNTTNLSDSGSWDTLPTSSDVAVFDSTYATVGNLNTGALVQWQGIRILSPGGNVVINNSTSGQEVALGASGIDMSSATVNLNIQRLRVDASQTWNIASGRTFNLGSSSSARTGVLSLGSGGPFTITKSGAGTVQLDTSNTAIGNVNWNVQAGLIRAIWNGSSAWGTGTITLGGGGIAVGTNFTGSVGNWTWNNNITLTDSTSSFIDNQNIAGADRWLKLEGAISGSGNLEFRDTGTGFTNLDAGFILTGTNTHTGNVTIAAGAEVRVGGANAGTQDDIAGNNGKLAGDSALVTNNGTLTFGRLDSHTVANAISGTGNLRVGMVNALGGSSTSTQVVTLSGANTYTGTTTVNNGRLNLTGSLTSNISLAAAGRISGTGSTTGTLTTATGSGIFLTGGATLNGLVANGVTIGGATSVSFLSNPTAATTYDVFTYGTGGLSGFGNLTAAWRGSFSDDTGNNKVVFITGNTATRTWNTTTGTWDNTGTNTNWIEGDNKFYDGDDAVFGDIASDSTITLSTNIAPGSVLVQNSANAYTFSGGALTGATGLTKSNAGTLILTNTNTNTGATSVTGGVLDVGNGGTTGSLGSGAISVASGAEIVFNRSNAFTVSNTISGAGLVTKKGAGRMTVNGNNSGGTVNWYFTGTGNGDINFANANAVGTGSTLTLADNAVGSAFFPGSGNTSDLALSIGSGANFTWNGSTGNTNTISGVMSGSGTFTKVSGETLILTGASTFSGPISNSGGGTLQIGGAGVLGSGNYSGTISNAATFTVNTTSDQTLGGVISGGGVLNKSNSGTLTLTAGNTYSGSTNVNSGTLAITSGGGIYRGGFNNTAVVGVGTGATLELQNWNYNEGTASLGGLQNAAARIVVNGGTIRMTGTTAYGRGVTVNAGGATFEAASGATWSFDNTGDGNIPFVYNGDPSLAFVGDGSFVFNKAFSGTTGTLTKTGAGTLTLPAASTYSGGTTVNGGTLLVTNTGGSATGTGTVTVTTGTLGGTGLIAGPVVIGATGNVAPGTGAGTLYLDDALDLSAMAAGAGKLKFQLGALAGTNDQLDVLGTVDLGSLALDDLEITNLGGLEVGTYTLIISGGFDGSVDGTVAPIAPGFNGQLQTNGDNLELVVTAGAGITYADWIDSFFPDETDPDIIGAGADPDKDGISNAVELVIGGDPKDGMDTAFLPTLELVTDPVSSPAIPSGSYLLFTYRRTADSENAAVTAGCETDTDLVGQWTPATNAVDGVVIQEDLNFTFTPPAPAGTDQVRVYVPLGSNSKLFGRLNVVVP